jgi:hypothetical protein
VTPTFIRHVVEQKGSTVDGISTSPCLWIFVKSLYVSWWLMKPTN